MSLSHNRWLPHIAHNDLTNFQKCPKNSKALPLNVKKLKNHGDIPFLFLEKIRICSAGLETGCKPVLFVFEVSFRGKG